MKQALLSAWFPVALMAALGVAGSEARTIDFDRNPPGQVPKGWTVSITGEGTPAWRVQVDASAPSSTHVLEQSGVTPKPSFPLCLKTGSKLKDGYVEVKFKPVRGTIDQAAGLVWRAKDSQNYYVCRANALENNVVLYKVQGGVRKALDIVGHEGGYGVETPVVSGKWQTLRVEFAGSQFKVFLNGAWLFAVEDATFTQPGQVGLWTKADSATRFDDFKYGSK